MSVTSKEGLTKKLKMATSMIRVVPHGLLWHLLSSISSGATAEGKFHLRVMLFKRLLSRFFLVGINCRHLVNTCLDSTMSSNYYTSPHEQKDGNVTANQWRRLKLMNVGCVTHAESDAPEIFNTLAKPSART